MTKRETEAVSLEEAARPGHDLPGLCLRCEAPLPGEEANVAPICVQCFREEREAVAELMDAALVTHADLDIRLRYRLDVWTKDERAKIPAALSRCRELFGGES